MKRRQIPVSDQESYPCQTDEALRDAAPGSRKALARLKTLEAPIAAAQTMIEESVTGRYL
jgi:hypothetical protein